MNIKGMRDGAILGLFLLAHILLLYSPIVRADSNGESDQNRSARARIAFQMLSAGQYTYRRQPLDDKLSGQVFDAYLIALDPQNNLYNKADLASLEKYRLALDEAVKSGALDPIYHIARVAQEASRTRCRLALSIRQQTAAHDKATETVKLSAVRAGDGIEAKKAWTAEVYARRTELESMGIRDQALADKLGMDFCFGIDDEADDRERGFGLFLDSYAKLSDGHGSYRSPFLDPIPVLAVEEKNLSLLPVNTLITEVDGKRIGIIVIHHLNPGPIGSVTLEVLNAIADVSKYGIDGVLLDLRGNEGGSLRAVVDIAGLFVGPSPILQIKEADGRVSVETSEYGQKWTGPLAVLIDNKTAAGAEILAAALQDHGRAILLGEKSFGNGTIQNRFAIGQTNSATRIDDAITITIAEVFRLNGQPLDGVGVVPDFQLNKVQDVTTRKSSSPVSKPISPAPGHRILNQPAVKDGASGPTSTVAIEQQSAADPMAAQAALVFSSQIASRSVVASAKEGDDSLASRYMQALRSDVVSEWNFPADARDMPSCKVKIGQLPGGEVVSVSVDSTCPDHLPLRNSIEAAIIKASPLPYAGFESVFSANIVLNFKAGP